MPRKAGWDTHGLPVEVEVEKELRIHGKAAIEVRQTRADSYQPELYVKPNQASDAQAVQWISPAPGGGQHGKAGASRDFQILGH